MHTVHVRINYILAYMHTYTHAYIHTYIHTHLYAYRYTQIQTHLLRDEGVIVYNNRVKLSLFQWQPNLPEILWKLEY